MLEFITKNKDGKIKYIILSAKKILSPTWKLYGMIKENRINIMKVFKFFDPYLQNKNDDKKYKEKKIIFLKIKIK